MIIGTREDGKPAVMLFEDSLHTLLAGETRSGKSMTAYSILAQACLVPGAVVVGIDPSGLLLLPFCRAGEVGDGSPWCILGTRDPRGYLVLLERLTTLMDHRIRQLNEGADSELRDRLDPKDQTHPLVIIVLEEFIGAISVARSADTALQPRERMADRILAQVGRIAFEGLKVNMRLLTLVQRPDAAIFGPGVRDQYTRRIAHRLKSDGASMMFSGVADSAGVSRLAQAQPGVALWWEAGGEPRFARSRLFEYSDYARFVRSRYRGTAALDAEFGMVAQNLGGV